MKIIKSNVSREERIAKAAAAIREQAGGRSLIPVNVRIVIK